MLSVDPSIPKPFLKWAGGKGQLLGELCPRAGRSQFSGRYHEPFIGGGALFFGMYRNGEFEQREALLSDSNPNLVATYLGVRDDVEGVIALLREHKAAHGEEHYYAVRAEAPEDPAAAAARVIYLNRTCFNGLYRENSKGQFNVPMGRYKDPRICDAENLRAVAKALAKAKLEQRHFETVLECAEPGDFVYFDPPYHPLSETSSFTSYAKEGFGEADQRQLAGVFRELDRRGVFVMLSNSMTPFVRELYEGFPCAEVYASRAVNSKAGGRGKIAEALITNFTE